MEVEIFVPIVMFLVVGFCIGSFFYYRFRARQELQLTVRAAIDSGQTLSVDVLEEITSALHPKKNDLRKGMVYVALALAFLMFGFFVPDEEASMIMAGLAAFPLFVGLAYLVLWRLNPDSK